MSISIYAKTLATVFSHRNVRTKRQAYTSLSDRTLAYEFRYPVGYNEGKKFNLIYSRKPERYSSAAPLTTNARQRIVCELVDLPTALTISVYVGPSWRIL